jgi:hypothetical protein
LTEERVVLLVPRRADHGLRDSHWEHCRNVWAGDFPGWPIVEGHHGPEEGPFNRSAAVNRAAALAGDWDVAVVIDSDVVPDPAAVRWAVEEARRSGGPASAFNVRKNLNQAGTAKVKAGYRGSWERMVGGKWPDCISGAFALTRDLWDRVGGFDEMFVGWGYEDTAFRIACETVSNRPLARAQADLWHLYHPQSPEHRKASPDLQRNRSRMQLYETARFDMTAIAPLIAQAKAARGDAPPGPPPPPAYGSRIPRTVHRTVPEETTPEQERCWETVQAAHSDEWAFLDHRDPLDPSLWPETGDLWERCSSGAQKAGLIRLEALWRHGGIYVDSDYEAYRSFEPLIQLPGFAGWEDARVVPDAVMGFRPGHQAVSKMLQLARKRVLAGEGAWRTGPGVTTSVLPGRGDVLLLPPGSLYPYHYKEKETMRRRDHKAEQPWAFGAHHWAHSWDGS